MTSPALTVHHGAHDPSAAAPEPWGDVLAALLDGLRRHAWTSVTVGRVTYRARLGGIWAQTPAYPAPASQRSTSRP